MCNVVNKHNICNLAQCAKYLQSLNHAASRDYTQTSAREHTRWAAAESKAELNVSAKHDHFSITLIIGNDHVLVSSLVCWPEAPLSSTQHLKNATCNICSSRCGCSSHPCTVSPTPDLYPSSYSTVHASTHTHTHTNMGTCTVFPHIWAYACREGTHTHPH